MKTKKRDLKYANKSKDRKEKRFLKPKKEVFKHKRKKVLKKIEKGNDDCDT
jgi:hypothetical protein